MKHFNLFLFVILCVRLSFCKRFQDYLPIKHDVTKVRTESQMLSQGGHNTALDFIGLVERHRGYSAEEHQVTTSDGYRLTVHRITGSPSSPKASGKPVIFFQHGMLGSSDGLVFTGPKKSLAFLLADAGYDVWLGNARGNTYSRSHTTLQPKDKKFWDFSWHEIGLIDVRTSIDLALKKSGKKQLVYIGFSVGATASYVLLSKLPEYNKKISLVISLAPLAFWRQKLLPAMKYGVDNFQALQEFSEKNKFYEVFPQSGFTADFSKALCANAQQPLCSEFVKNFLPIFDVSRLSLSYPNLLKYIPAGGSMKTFFHYIQNAIDNKFQEYDYGVLKNLEKYSQKSPPLYNLTRVTTSVALIYGNQDPFTSKVNSEVLKSKLPNVVLCQAVPYSRFNHMDFLFAEDIKEVLYDQILSLIQNFNNYYVY